MPEPPEPEATDAMDKLKDVISLHPQAAKVFGPEAENTNMDTDKDDNLLSTLLPNLGEETQNKEESGVKQGSLPRCRGHCSMNQFEKDEDGTRQ